MMWTLLLVGAALTSTTTSTTSTTATSTQTSTQTSAEAPTTATLKLRELRALLADVQCERLVELAPYVEDHRLATTPERQEASFMRAYCLVTLGNLAEAQGVLAGVFAEDVDAVPPFEMEPRVRVIVDAARTDERSKREAVLQAARDARRARIRLEVIPPTRVEGGNRAFFDVRVTDPAHEVASLRLEFRKKPLSPTSLPPTSTPTPSTSTSTTTGATTSSAPARAADFYALPVERQKDGWRGEIPGTYTRSTTGLDLEWYVVASAADGEVLANAGSRAAANVLAIAPGSSLARDLRANERLAHETRVLLALLWAPTLSTAMSVGAVLAAPGLATVFGANNVAGVLSFVALPAGAAVGQWLAVGPVLDGTDNIIAVGVAAGAGLIAGVPMAVALFEGKNQDALFWASAGGIGVGVASAATATTLVLLDAPE
jgi:hypothetical protein